MCMCMGMCIVGEEPSTNAPREEMSSTGWGPVGWWVLSFTLRFYELCCGFMNYYYAYVILQ